MSQGTETENEAITLDLTQAMRVFALFGGEPGEVTIRKTNGHSGVGLYAHFTEYPEEGSFFMGETDPEAAVTDKQVNACKMDDQQLQALTLVAEVLKHAGEDDALQALQDGFPWLKEDDCPAVLH